MSTVNLPPIRYEQYKDERDLPPIMALIAKDLSEPYSIYTYRYFLHSWPSLCFLAHVEDECIGTIICRLAEHRGHQRGYIAMLAVSTSQRKRGIGTQLVERAIEEMKRLGADEIVLETETTNRGALHLYERLGFARDKRLHRYYLNGVDAFRLKLWTPSFSIKPKAPKAEEPSIPTEQLSDPLASLTL
ncbi:MAG: acyl-CoA N-acyltransferase [Piptocephalis tieghemiana]|nr:MAG: acyl-CoA N-acyltransferase [Piptocephalis tieghemiana]